jgi:hypothetical protein
VKLRSGISAVLILFFAASLVQAQDLTADKVLDGVNASASDLDSIAYTNDDYEEVERLLKAKPGKRFNFSSDEFKKLGEVQKQARSLDRAGQIEAASNFMREVLLNRYLSYENAGLAGIDGYWRSKRKTISIGDELRMTSEALDPLEGEFGSYYQLLLKYPENAECCEHIFRWLKFDLRDRPTYSLSHSIIERTETHLVFTERHYYVSSSLNSTQISLAWIPFEEGTYMGLAISASTDILDSFMGRMLRPLGRNKARDLVSDTLTEIRTDLHDASETNDE